MGYGLLGIGIGITIYGFLGEERERSSAETRQDLEECSGNGRFRGFWIDTK